MQIATGKRTITVEHATAENGRLLDLGDYNCLAVVAGQTFNADGVLFEYTQSRHQPDCAKTRQLPEIAHSVSLSNLL